MSNKLAKNLANSWSVIQPLEALPATSIQLVDRYDLRAADSFRLAAALEWSEYAPQGRVFLTADQKLALLSGFDASRCDSIGDCRGLTRWSGKIDDLHSSAESNEEPD